MVNNFGKVTYKPAHHQEMSVYKVSTRQLIVNGKWLIDN